MVRTTCASPSCVHGLLLLPLLTAHTCLPSSHAPPTRSVFDELFGGLLTPDEVVYAVLLRGYGGAARPNWNEMSSCLTEMESKHGITPSTGAGGEVLPVQHCGATPAAPAAALLTPVVLLQLCDGTLPAPSPHAMPQ